MQVVDRVEEALAAAGHKGMRPRYAGRDAAASPATGFAKRHEKQQAALVADALGIAVAPPTPPKTAAAKKLA